MNICIYYSNILFLKPFYRMLKQERLKKYKEYKCENIINNTCFFYNPISGKYCGYCSPCRRVMIVGMSYRLPKVAL